VLRGGGAFNDPKDGEVELQAFKELHDLVER
jgi:hypothetical protein